MRNIILIICCVSCIFGQFNSPSFTSYKYVPPQSIGGGMMSQGKFVETHNQYVPPQSIGGGMMEHGGFVEKVIPQPSPVIQTIIDIATFTARGKQPNN